MAALAVANTVVSLAYYLRVISPMYFHPAPHGTPAPVLGRWAGGTASATAVLVVATGLGAELIIAALDDALLLP